MARGMRRSPPEAGSAGREFLRGIFKDNADTATGKPVHPAQIHAVGKLDSHRAGPYP
jgi:hypothetical protein